MGEGLRGYLVKEMTEVFQLDGAGKEERSLGFLEDNELALGFIEAHSEEEAKRLRARDRFVLTNGTDAFLVGDAVFLINAGKAEEKIRKSGLAKLTVLERKLLCKERG